MHTSRTTFAASTLLLTLALAAPPAPAGCGCQKPPPELASLRPNATYGNAKVTLFHPALQVGSTYIVQFQSGTNAQKNARAEARAVSLRDLADGLYKPQLVVNLPDSLPLGPTSVSVTDRNGTQLLSLGDDALTVIPKPMAMPTDLGTATIKNYQAAVGRDGTMYVSLDMTKVTQPRTFTAQAVGYPLRFTSDEVVFYNVQGFLMQLLKKNMPGLFSLTPPSSATDSDVLEYSRHEFNTYFLQHAERQPHQVDPTDGNWHIDGTRHVDHNFLVLAIAGVLNDGTTPPPGSTPPFTLTFQVFSLFHHGLVGASGVKLDNFAATDGYDPVTSTRSADGDLMSNGKVEVSGKAQVQGDTDSTKVTIAGSALVSGKSTTEKRPPLQFLLPGIPDLLPDLGDIKLAGTDAFLLPPGSYRVRDIMLSQNASLYVDNVNGPVTIYVTGKIEVKDHAAITVTDPDPERCAVYVMNNGNVSIKNDADFYGVIYAPQSNIDMVNSGEVYGAIVGNSIGMKDSAMAHYDVRLRGSNLKPDESTWQ